MDFYYIAQREIEKGPRKGEIEIYPDFRVTRSKDLMVRGRAFYAVWDEEQQLWSTDEYELRRLVDEDLERAANDIQEKTGNRPHVKSMYSFGSKSWSQFRNYVQNISDNSHSLDDRLTFADTQVKKTDYASKRLPYACTPGDYSAWDELVGTLYSVEERAKIEWVIGAIVSGDSTKIQKFLVFYGSAGTGKSTILNIIEKLFSGYTTTFDAKALGANGNAFATEAFKSNPLVAIQHDGDLSRIEDNTKLNSIISHEDMPMNEKYKPGYTSRVNAFLLMGTNQPVKISDAKSGIIRRLIDVNPTGVKIPKGHYDALMSRIDFELGAIAYHCLQVYQNEMGKNYYSAYRPVEMMFQTDIFFNFIEYHFDIFKEQDSTTIQQAYALYKEYCANTGIEKPKAQYLIRTELQNYFEEFHEKKTVNGIEMRSYYEGFTANKFKQPLKDDHGFSLVLEETESLFDKEYGHRKAQYATESGIPKERWTLVKSKLEDLDTSKEHYVKVPQGHIIIDFDLKDETGEKSAERNLEAASGWPATYAEYSRGGGGLHLHYDYDGDTDLLSGEYSDGIEVKVYRGNSSLRRKLSKCNNIPVATMKPGKLPLKEKKMLTENTVKSEKGLRDLIGRNLRKEIHPGTKPSIDFIHKILEDAYSSGMNYDLTNMRGTIVAFANNSSNQQLECLRIVKNMKFKSDNVSEVLEEAEADGRPDAQTVKASDDRVAFFDVEVYPNLFIVCWKFHGEDNVTEMINPTPQDMEQLMKLKLGGFYNRQYDNHIIYARYMGFDNARLYKLSQQLISGEGGNAKFGEAYNLSFCDIYDFASIKMSLKKWEIELRIPHKEMEIDWDKPVPDEDIPKVVEYCCNDVRATEAVFDDRKADFVARQILAALSGLPINESTRAHTQRILFGNDRKPQDSFIYTDLSKEFPGYEFEGGKSSYKGEDPSEGGYVYAEPGMYENVAVLDVASMHPASIEALNLFGTEYTRKFSELRSARIAIKRKQFDLARKMLDGRLEPYLRDETDADRLAYALKIVINIVYGLTSARFPNAFRDNRNVDNIVAKRGALFMIDLKEYVQKELGLQVVHIKTDSIKVVNPTEKQIEAIMAFGGKYSYEFEHEVTYDKFCLIDKAQYIARKGNDYDAVGAQFQHPYVFKTLFTKEKVEFDDLCEAKAVSKGAIYLDFEHDRPAVLAGDKMHFVGKVGLFVPVREGNSGAMMYKVQDGKKSSVSGTKGYLWLESEMAKELPWEELDFGYFETLADESENDIEKHGSYADFVK